MVTGLRPAGRYLPPSRRGRWSGPVAVAGARVCGQRRGEVREAAGRRSQQAAWVPQRERRRRWGGGQSYKEGPEVRSKQNTTTSYTRAVPLAAKTSGVGFWMRLHFSSGEKGYFPV